EGGNARRVIAAEAVAHHRDAVGIDLRAGGDVVVSGGAGDLVIVTAVDVAQAQRFGLAGPGAGERVDAALGEIQAGADHAHFLGVVHAVEQHDGGAPAAARAAHEIGGQARPLVGHLDALDLGIEALHRRVTGAQRLAIHRHLLRAGRDEALGAIVVVARAHVVAAGGGGGSLRPGGVGGAGEAGGHSRPLLAPHPNQVGV